MTQSEHCFYWFSLLLLQFITKIYRLQVVLWRSREMWRVGEKENAPGLTYCSAWYLQLFTPWSTVSHSRDQSVFIYEGTKRHLSALSWSQWQCIVWLWGGEWIVFLPLGHTGTHPRQDVVVCDSTHTHPVLLTTFFHLHPLPRSRHPSFLRSNDLKIEHL